MVSNPKPITIEHTHRNTVCALAGKNVVGKATAWEDSRGEFVIMKSEVRETYRRRGVATAMYKAIEEISGRELKPAASLSDDAFEFWKRYRPESVANDLRHRQAELLGRKVKKDERDGTIIKASGGVAIVRYDDAEVGAVNSETYVLRKDLEAAMAAAVKPEAVPQMASGAAQTPSIPLELKSLAEMVRGKGFEAAKRAVVAKVGSVDDGELFDDEVADAVFLRLQRVSQVGRYTEESDLAYRNARRLEGDGDITIYRALPQGLSIRPGDFASNSDHEAGFYTHGDNKIQAFTVPRRAVIAVDGSMGGGEEYVYLPKDHKATEPVVHFESFREFYEAANSKVAGNQDEHAADIQVDGFRSFEAVPRNDGSIGFHGTAKVDGSMYFANLTATRREDGTMKVSNTNFETMTGKSVRGSANVRLENLMDKARDAALMWAIKSMTPASVGDKTQSDSMTSVNPAAQQAPVVAHKPISRKPR